MSLSQANFSFFSFIFQVVSRCVYEAFLFYLTNHERPIDWTATVLQRYVDERRSKDGQHIDFKVVPKDKSSEFRQFLDDSMFHKDYSVLPLFVPTDTLDHLKECGN